MTRVTFALLFLTTACGGGGSPCGLPNGSRCASANVLQQCDDNNTVEVSCLDQGRLCGPDPMSPDTAACVQSGDECMAIDANGGCAGDTLAFCVGSELTVVDCSEQYAQCTLDLQIMRYVCTTPCTEANVDTRGRCNGPTSLTRCTFEDGAYAVTTEACQNGATCQTSTTTGAFACLSTPCASVGPLGSCSADVLTRCVGGTPQITDCAALSLVCGYGGDDVGYVCAQVGAMGAQRVSGVVRYEDRPALASGLGPITLLPARGVSVALIDDRDSSVISVAVAADDGSYQLRHDIVAGVSVHVLVAATQATAQRPVRVIRPDGRVHGFGSPSFAVAANNSQDVLITNDSGAAPAFNIYDVLLSGVDFVRNDLGAVPSPLFAHWVRGSIHGTFYDMDTNGIFLLGYAADDDGYDDAVILHELGHYFEDEFSRLDSPGGPHDGSPTDPLLAWSEGFSTYFSGAVRNDPLYVDTNAMGGWTIDAESTVTVGDALAPPDQLVREDLVTEVLWDAGDSPSGDDDGITSASHITVLRVMLGYFLDVAFVDRGVAGVDLIDWLDGWFVDNGLTTCADMQSVVTIQRKFPYDFTGPAGACP